MEVKILNSYPKTWYVPPTVVVERVIQVSDQPPLYIPCQPQGRNHKKQFILSGKMAPNSSSSKTTKIITWYFGGKNAK